MKNVSLYQKIIKIYYGLGSKKSHIFDPMEIMQRTQIQINNKLFQIKNDMKCTEVLYYLSIIQIFMFIFQIFVIK